MKLSEQIAETCCGVLANKQDMIDRAEKLEDTILLYEEMFITFESLLKEVDYEE